MPEAIASEHVDWDRSALIAEIHGLRRRTALLAAFVGLLIVLLRAPKTRIDFNRFAEGEFKVELHTDLVASLLVVLIMGLAHLEILAPGRIGDEERINVLESSVGDLLARSTWRRR